MRDVVVLNASYEPLRMTSWEDAILRVIANKAIIEEAIENKFIRYANGQFPWPRVIRLLKYVKTPYLYGELPYTKMGVLKRDNYTCAYCGKKADTVDHILPQSRRPDLARDWMNVVSSCFRDNNKKGARTPEEAHMTLLFQPTVPRGLRRR